MYEVLMKIILSCRIASFSSPDQGVGSLGVATCVAALSSVLTTGQSVLPFESSWSPAITWRGEGADHSLMHEGFSLIVRVLLRS